jgi:hypothetical protein
MPLQDHWERQNTPLRQTTSRERRIVRVAIGLLVIAVIAGTIVAIGSSSPKTPTGCIHVELPSTMGGVSSQLCGSAARTFCQGPAVHTEPLNATVLPKCRMAGFD